MSLQAEEVLERLENINKNIEQSALHSGRDVSDITLMAVTKTVPVELVNAVLNNGVHLIGENRVQEYLSKKDLYINGHYKADFIGHLQTNKVKCIINDIRCIESVDSIHLMSEINNQAKKINKICDIFLEINVAKEKTKSGFYVDDLDQVFEFSQSLCNTNLCGLMCVPPVDSGKIYFPIMKKIFDEYKEKYNLKSLSMGMSGDYQIAIENGATVIRLGSALFGKRNYGGSEK